jgi:hypothetical protein
VDAVVSADLAAFIRVALGYLGLREALARGLVGFSGGKSAIATLCGLLRLADEPVQKRWRFTPQAPANLGTLHRPAAMRQSANAA